MSARDKLFSVACDDMPVTSNEVNEAIDAYAHEIAEKIRAGKVREPIDEAEEHVNNVLGDLADEIDPKAKR